MGLPQVRQLVDKAAAFHVWSLTS